MYVLMGTNGGYFMKKIVGVSLIAVMLVCMLLGCAKSPNESKYDLSEELRECMIGDTILMGKYRQTRREKDGVDPIQWTVLAREDKKVLLISSYIIDYQQYNSKNGEEEVEVAWTTSSIRQWLNETFYENAFSSSEKNIILQSTVYDAPFEEGVSRYSLDKIFLISAEEELITYKMYDRRTESTYPTEYASGLGATGECWLRDVWNDWGWNYSARVETERHGGMSSRDILDYNGVRPVMWVEVN